MTNLPICTDHQLPFNVFCETCQKIICPMCIVGSHQKHDLSELGKVSAKLKSQFPNVLRDARSTIDQVLKTMIKIEKRIEVVGW